jgi:hypothetical protein
VALATGVRDAVALPAAGAFQDGGPRSLPGVPPGLGQQILPILSTTTVVPVVVLAAPERDASSVLVPVLLPPTPHVERGGDGALSGGAAADTDQPGGLVPGTNPGDKSLDQDAEAWADVRLPQWACDACFANGSWRADPAGLDTLVPAAESSGSAPDSVGAAVALTFALGGAWGAPWAQSEPRTRRRWLS